MYFLKISTFSDYNGNIDSLHKMWEREKQTIDNL